MEGLLVVLGGAWVLSPVILGILLAVEARRRRELGVSVQRLEARVGWLDQAVESAARREPQEEPTATGSPPESAAPAFPLPPPLPPASPPPAAAPAQEAPPAPRPAPPWRFDWERLVGVKLYSWLAGDAVAVPSVSFARYSTEHGYLVPPVRMAIGVAAGLALLVGAETRAARRYAVTAQALAAGGTVTLFATFWAAHALWHLVPALATFGLLALVTAVAVLLAVRRHALVVAVLGLAGGFATPWLLATGQDRPLGLFSYLLLLNVGLAWVARRKGWPLLSAMALALTTVYQAGWVLRFLDTADELPIAVGVFLLFAAFGVAALALATRGGAAVPRLARTVAALGTVPPAAFALYAATQPWLWERWPLLFGFVAVIAAGLAAVSAWQGPEWHHHVGAGAAVATAGAVALLAGADGAGPGVLAFVLLLAAVDLAAPHVVARLGRPLRAEGRLGVWGAPLLFLVLVALARAGAAPAPWAYAGATVLLLAGCGASAAARRDALFQAISAAGATIAAGELARAAGAPGAAGAGTAALAAAIALGLAALAVPLAARRRGSPLRLALEGAPPLEAFALGAHLVLLVVATSATGASPSPSAHREVLAALLVLQLALVADGLHRAAGAVLAAGTAAGALVLLTLADRGLAPAATSAAGALLVGSALLVAWRTSSDRLALAAAAIGAACAVGHWLLPAAPWDALAVAAPLWLLPLAYPLLRGARGRGERLAYAGAVLASAAAFPVARDALLRLGGAPWIGALPLVQAALLVPHLALLVRGAGAAPSRGILALVAGAALGFVTAAIPLQLEKQWITIGWALEAAALAWLWRRVPHRGLLAACAGLLLAVLVRLVANPELLRYHPRAAPIWNWWLYAYLTAAAAAFVAARLLAGGDDRLRPGWPRLSSAAAAQGAVLLFALVNVEIADYFSTGPRLVFRLSAGLAQDLTYTIAWAIFALGLLAAGVVLASRPSRAAAIALLSATVLKAFLHDLARLDGLYRVASFVGLAASLAAVAIVLQRFVLRSAEDRPDPEAT